MQSLPSTTLQKDQQPYSKGKTIRFKRPSTYQNKTQISDRHINIVESLKFILNMLMFEEVNKTEKDKLYYFLGQLFPFQAEIMLARNFIV